VTERPWTTISVDPWRGADDSRVHDVRTCRWAAAAVLACLVGIAALVGCAVSIGLWLAGAVHGLVLTHGAATLLLAAAGGLLWLAVIAVFAIMLADLLRR
jgi:hypothetical protein